MTHGRMEFEMPASAEVVFDAFHFHFWRARWDSLGSETQVRGDAPCPFVGAVSTNRGRGWLAPLAMTTRFVSFDRPVLAAATMDGRAFPFSRWAASMRHIPRDGGRSTLVYTYTFDTGPAWLRWLLEPMVARAFARQTRKRFLHLAGFLSASAAEVEQWQAAQPTNAADPRTGE